jgi:hypothetical protein
MKKIQPKQVKKQDFFWLPKAAYMTKKMCFLGHNSSTKDWNLIKISVS